MRLVQVTTLFALLLALAENRGGGGGYRRPSTLVFAHVHDVDKTGVNICPFPHRCIK